jgi:putative membrane protein insertion efficiency factor
MNPLHDETSQRRLQTLGRLVCGLPAWLAIGLVRLYQWTISPLLGPRCRFQPTCSTYFVESVVKYGVVRGSWRGLRRLCRCHPWSPGGYDPP